MSKVMGLMAYFPVLFLLLFFTVWVRLFSTAQIEYEDTVLEKQINYATDSALGEMLYESNVPYNSADPYSNVKLDAEYGMEDFCRVMCYNKGWMPTETNIKMIQNRYIKGAALAEWDGVYGWAHRKYETAGHGLMLAPKVPYYMEWEGWQYCLTLGYKECYRAGGDSYQLQPLNRVPSNLTEDIQGTYITKKLGDVLTSNIFLSYTYGDDKGVVSIPTTLRDGTDKGIQDVHTPTFIVYMEGERTSPFSTKKAIALGGSSLTEVTQYIGYTLPNGSKQFYTDKQIAPKNGTADGSWTNPYDAAKAGYVDMTWIE